MVGTRFWVTLVTCTTKLNQFCSQTVSYTDGRTVAMIPVRVSSLDTSTTVCVVVEVSLEILVISCG